MRLGHGRRAFLLNVLLGHLNVSGQRHHHLQDGAAGDGDFVGGRGQRGIDEVELVARLREPQQAAHFPALGQNFAGNIGAPEDEDGAFFPTLTDDGAQVHAAGFLDLPEQFNRAQKIRVGRLHLAAAQRAVAQSVQAIHTQRQDEVRSVTGLHHAEDRRRRDRLDHVAEEAITGKRLVGNGRAVDVNALSAQHEAISLDRALAGQLAAGADGSLPGVPADDLVDIQKNGCVHVTELDEIGERLFLPRIGNGVAVIHTVPQHGRGAERMAAAERQNKEERRQQTEACEAIGNG